MKLRKIAKILGGLLALVIVVLLAIPMFVSAEYLKAQLVAQVKNATGRELIIKGDASLKIFPTIAVSVQDVTLGNPQGFSGAYFVHIDTLKTGAALKPLLSKRLSITGITVEGMDLKLEENANGAKNWDFANAKPAAKDDAAKPANDTAAKKASPLNGFSLGDVTLKDSAISMVKPGAKAMAVRAINLSISGADGSKALKVDGSAEYQNETVKLSVVLEKMQAFLGGKPSPLELSVALPAGSIGFKGNAHMGEALGADGALDVAVDDLPALLAWATAKPAAAGLPKKVTLKTALQVQNPKSLALNDLAFSADTLAAKGKLAVNLEGAVPSIRGALAMGALDLDALTGGAKAAPAAASAKADQPAAAASTGWSEAPLNMAGLRAVNANLDVTIGTLTSGKMTVSDITANVALSGGVMKLTLGNAALYSGTAKGVVTVDGSGAGMGLATNLNLAGIEIEPLMTAMSGASRLAGKAEVNLAITGRGASQRALVGTLGGNGGMKVRDGAIKGINIAQFLRSAKQGFVFGEHTSETTDFTELSASFTMAQGVLTSNDLAMKSPVLRLSGTGTVSLPPKTINYRLVPTLVGSLQGQGGKDGLSGIDVPLLITGPWSKPSITPDIAGMLKDPAKLKDNINAIGSSLRDYNSPKDIGRALLGGKTETAPAATPTTPATTTAPAAEPAKPTKQQKLEQGIGGLLNTLGK
ncbi:MAG: AsmA family protein [Pseudomonadota bacterium]